MKDKNLEVPLWVTHGFGQLVVCLSCSSKTFWRGCGWKSGNGIIIWLLVLLLGLGIMIGSLFAAYLNRGRVEVGVTE